MIEEIDVKEIKKLEKKSNEIRNQIIEMAIKSGGHVASSLSCVEILVALYYGNILKIDVKDPTWDERDRFIMSKGHGEMALYAILSNLGFFPKNLLETNYRRGNCCLGGHPDCKTPGVEVTTGSLGHGLGIAAGISLAAKIDRKTHIQYVLMGDAECTEGAIWETALFASKHCLNNLIGIIDRNHIGVLDFTENYTNLEPFLNKWQAFGWDVVTINGHNFDELLYILRRTRMRDSYKPLIIIAETIKGKGVTFMENNPIWHVLPLSKENDIKQAKQELQWEENENIKYSNA
jgi:transketolase